MNKLEASALVGLVIFSDVRVRTKSDQFVKAIEADGVIPTEEEIDLLVMGNDEGDVPEDLQQKYPHLYVAIGEVYK